jgi:very-short-patch-repair endonuclease
MTEREGRNYEDSPPALAGGGWGEGVGDTSLLTHARSMRRAPTPAERKLWQGLRKHQVVRLKFRRQVPRGPYIIDFYCPSARLVVEVDGVLHVDASGDAVRDAWMSEHKIHVVRFSNSEVLANLEGILVTIGMIARAPPPPNTIPQGVGESLVTTALPSPLPHV